MKTRIFLAVYYLWVSTACITFYILSNAADWARNHILVYNIMALIFLSTITVAKDFPAVKRKLSGIYHVLYLIVELLILCVSTFYCGWIGYMVTEQTLLCAGIFGGIQLAFNIGLLIYGL